MKKVVISMLLSMVFSFSIYSQKIVDENSKVITIESTGEGFIGSGITIEMAKEIAISDAKRNAIEYAGTYLKSSRIAKDHMITKDEIITIAGGIIKLEDVEIFKKLENEQFVINAKILAAIDMSSLNKVMNDLAENYKLKNELNEEKKKVDFLFGKIKELERREEFNEHSDITGLLNSLSASDYFIKGIEAKTNSDYDKALYCYSKAIELDNTFGRAYNNRGIVYGILNKNYYAIEDFKKAIEFIDDEFLYAYYNLGLIFYKIGEKDLTKQYLEFYLKNSKSIKQSDEKKIREMIK